MVDDQQSSVCTRVTRWPGMWTRFMYFLFALMRTQSWSLDAQVSVMSNVLVSHIHQPEHSSQPQFLMAVRDILGNCCCDQSLLNDTWIDNVMSRYQTTHCWFHGIFKWSVSGLQKFSTAFWMGWEPSKERIVTIHRRWSEHNQNPICFQHVKYKWFKKSSLCYKKIQRVTI